MIDVSVLACYISYAGCLCFSRIPVDILRSWESSFNSLLTHPEGVRLFEGYLKTEFSEENIQFWKACERFKTLPEHQIEAEAELIYNEFIDPQAAKLVSSPLDLKLVSQQLGFLEVVFI